MGRFKFPWQCVICAPSFEPGKSDLPRKGKRLLGQTCKYRIQVHGREYSMCTMCVQWQSVHEFCHVKRSGWQLKLSDIGNDSINVVMVQNVLGMTCVFVGPCNHCTLVHFQPYRGSLISQNSALNENNHCFQNKHSSMYRFNIKQTENVFDACPTLKQH